MAQSYHQMLHLIIDCCNLFFCSSKRAIRNNTPIFVLLDENVSIAEAIQNQIKNSTNPWKKALTRKVSGPFSVVTIGFLIVSALKRIIKL